MADIIFKEPYIKPKVELTLDEYNKLVDMARMKSKKLERRAREIFEKEGVVTINFEGTIRRKRFGELCSEHYDFKCHTTPFPSDDAYNTNKVFGIPQKERERIAQKVSRYVEEVFVANFGENLYHINEAKKLEAKADNARKTFIVVTFVGWLLATLLFGICVI